MNRQEAIFQGKQSRDVVKAIVTVHFQGCTFLDATYGKGAFWTETVQPAHASDLSPRFSFVYKADARHLPFTDDLVDVIVFDPLHQHGVSGTTTLKQQEDFSRLFNQKEVRALYREAAPELRRVASQGAIIKTTDMVESGKFNPTHIMVARELFEQWSQWPAGIAILNSGVVRPTRHTRVLHLRHAHSYFLIYKWGKDLKRLG